jgi:hypothetical protein
MDFSNNRITLNLLKGIPLGRYAIASLCHCAVAPLRRCGKKIEHFPNLNSLV